MKQWEDVEMNFPKFRNRKEKGKLRLQMTIYATAILVCAVIEHILTIMTSLHYVMTCQKDENVLDAFFRSHLFELFQFTSFAMWKSMFGKFANIIATFAWNYMNLFIVMVSIGISSRFKQLNDEMNRVKGEVSSFFRILCMNN